MRAISAGVMNNLLAVRTIGARLTFRDLRLVFSNVAVTDTIAGLAPLFHDCDTYSNGILRAAIFYNTTTWYRYLCYQWNPTPGTWGSWVNTGIRTCENSSVGVYANRIFYHNYTDGDGYYVDFTPGVGLGTPVNIVVTDADTPLAFAPISTDQVYLRWQYSGPPLTGPNIDYISHLTISTAAVVQWPGQLYGLNQFLTCFDAVYANGVEYIFVSDSDTKRALWLTRSGTAWSEPKQVVPLDVVDSTSSFMLGGATTINNQAFIMGVLYREGDNPMLIYSYGEGFWSLGRNMFIRGDIVPGTVSVNFGGSMLDFTLPAGKLLLIDDDIWYLTFNLCSRADATYLVGYDAAAKKTTLSGNFYGLDISLASNESNRLLARLQHDVATTNILPGSEMDVEISYGGNYATIGKFDVDAVIVNHQSEGDELLVTARSRAIKRIGQWQPDASFDYWSQTKVNSDADDLGNLVVGSGSWSYDAGTAQLETANLDSYVYFIERPAHGMMVRLKVQTTAAYSNYAPTHGIVLNYYKETKAEAAARLVVDEEQITEADYGHNGLLIRYGATEHSGSPGVGVYLLRSNVLTQKTSAALTIAASTVHWFQATHLNGQILVRYRLDASITWTNLINTVFTDLVETPWFRTDELGRGGFYVRNTTVGSDSFAFSSDDLVLPVHDNSGFPAADSVRVDEEVIVYIGKSANRVIIDSTPELTFAVGDLLESFTTIGAYEQEFGADDTTRFIRQRITMSADQVVRGARVYLKKTGSPAVPVEVALYTTPVDSENPIGDRLAAGYVPASDVTGSFGWKTVLFDDLTKVVTTGTYWLVLSMKGTEDPVNYYRTMLDAAGGYTGGTFFRFNDDTNVWTEMATADMPFELYGGQSEDENQICVDGISWPGAAEGYNDMALAVVGGADEGNLYRVTGCINTGTASRVIFFVSKTPRVGPDSTFHLVPTLLVSERGDGSTETASHSKDVPVDLYRPYSPVVLKAEYYSSELDMRLRDMIAEVAGKAGVDLTAEALDTISHSGASWEMGTQRLVGNTIFRFKINSMSAGSQIGLLFDIDVTGLAVTVSPTHVNFYDEAGAGAPTLVEAVPLIDTPAGWVTISIQNDIFSVWIGGMYITTFVRRAGMTEGPEVAEHYARPYYYGTCSFGVDWSEVDSRVDNYILDMGQDGVSLIDDLVTERRVFFQDDQYGDLRVFKDRVTVNAGSPYLLTVEASAGDTDNNVVTRLRVIGAEIDEGYDNTQLINYGNVFRSVYLQRLETLPDIRAERVRLLEEAVCRRTPYTLSGAFDPRVEPNDIVEVTLPEGNKNLVVDVQNIQLAHSLDEVRLDMQMEAHEST